MIKILNEPIIFKVLDISTGHITEEDNEILTSDLSNFPDGHTPISCEIIDNGSDGYLIYVPEYIEYYRNGPSKEIADSAFKNEIENLRKEKNYSKDLIDILVFARQHSCGFIRMHDMGTLYNDEENQLPEHNWEEEKINN